MKFLLFVAAAIMLAGCTRFVETPTSESETPATIDTQTTTKTTDTGSPTSSPIVPPAQNAQPVLPEPTFGTQTKSAHFVASNPSHGQILDAAPSSIEFTFNFDIDPSSTVSVTSNGVEYATGNPVVGADSLTLTQPLKLLPPGDYTVSYSACWPDQTCHPGQFEFAVR